tara:strand:- start:7241 stop:16402 length:9162 start_codon:yes stop_codon:yes gene_type:complete
MEKITKLYSVLKRDGFYTKSLDEFLKQFQDPAYQDKVFKVVTRERLFTKSKEEFLNTYSVKKKDDSVFPSEDGSSDSSETIETTEIPTNETFEVEGQEVSRDEFIAEEDRQQKIPGINLNPFDDRSNQYGGSTRQVNVAYEPRESGNLETISVPKGASKFEEALATINAYQIDVEEEEAEARLNYLFNDFGFTFEQGGGGILQGFDSITVTAPNGKSKAFNLDPVMGDILGGETSVANAMRQWMRENQTAESREKNIILSNDEQYRIFYSMQGVQESINALQEDENKFKERQADFLTQRNEWMQKQEFYNTIDPSSYQALQFKEEYLAHKERGKQIDALKDDLMLDIQHFKQYSDVLLTQAGKYVDYKSKKSGGFEFYPKQIWNAMMNTVGGIVSTVAGAAIDFAAEGLEIFGFGVVPGVSDFQELLGFDNTMGQSQEDFQQDYLNVLENTKPKIYEQILLKYPGIRDGKLEDFSQVREFTKKLMGTVSRIKNQKGQEETEALLGEDISGITEEEEIAELARDQHIKRIKDIVKGRPASAKDRDGNLIGYEAEKWTGLRNIFTDYLGFSDVSEEADMAVRSAAGAGAFIWKGILGGMESLPALVAFGRKGVMKKPKKTLNALQKMAANTRAYLLSPHGMQRSLQMSGFIADGINKEMENNPAFAYVSEQQKKSILLPIAVTSSILEVAGFRNLETGTNFTGAALKMALGQTTRKTTAKEFTQIVSDVVTNPWKKGALRTLGAATAEFETGLLQQLSEFEIKRLYDLVNNDEFNTPAMWSKEYGGKVLEAGLLEAIGGAALGSVAAMYEAATTDNLQSISNEMFELFNSIVDDKNFKTMYVADLKQQVITGEKTQEEADVLLYQFNQLAGLKGQIPSDMNADNKKKAIALLLRKQELQNQVEGKDESLTRKQRDEIKAIDNEMAKLSEESIEDIGDLEKGRKGIKVEVTEEDAIEELKQEGVENPSPKQIKEKQDAIYKRSTETLDAQESTEDSGQVGEGVSEQEPTQEGETEVETEDGTKTQEEIDLDREAQEDADLEQVLGDTNQTEEEVGDNLFRNTKGKTIDDTQNRKEKNTIYNRAKRGAKFIRKLLPGVSITLYDDNDVYNKAAGNPKGFSEPGTYIPESRKIMINVSMAAKLGRTGVIAHEIGHAVLVETLRKAGANSVMARKVARRLIDAVYKSGNLSKADKAKIEAFIAAGKYEENIRDEERFAEVVKIIATNFNNFSPANKTKIRRLLDKLIDALPNKVKAALNRLGFDVMTATDNEIIQFLQTIGAKIGAGVEAEAKDVKVLKKIVEEEKGDKKPKRKPKRDTKSKTQKEVVSDLLGEIEVGTIKEIAEITGLPEPTIRRILGQGTKKGEYRRVAPGIYTITTKDGKTAAIVQGADALSEIKRLVAEGAKFDMVFLDPPYSAPGIKGGNRNLAKYKKLTPEEFNEFVADVVKLLKNKNTPVIFMFSASKSNKATLKKYAQAFENNGLIPSGVAIETGKLDSKGKPKQMFGIPLKEWVFTYSLSGKQRTDIDFNFEKQYYFPQDSKYQTSKPVALLEAIIKASTKAGEIILDPFAGSGSTAKAAVSTGRNVLTIEENQEQAENIKKEVEKKSKKTGPTSGNWSRRSNKLYNAYLAKWEAQQLKKEKARQAQQNKSLARRRLELAEEYQMRGGFINNLNFDLQQLERKAAEVNLLVKPTYNEVTGQLNGYRFTTLGGSHVNPTKVEQGWNRRSNRIADGADGENLIKAGNNILEIVKIAIDNGFTNDTIKRYLKRRDYSTAEINEALKIATQGIFESLPKSFANLPGGIKSGLTLMMKISSKYIQISDTNRKNKNYNEKLEKKAAAGKAESTWYLKLREVKDDTQIMNEVVEYARTLPEYKSAGNNTSLALLIERDVMLALNPTPNNYSAPQVRELTRLIKAKAFAQLEIRQAQKFLRNFMRSVLPRDLYGKGEVISLIDKVNAIKTKEELPAVVKEVLDLVTTKANKSYMTSIFNILNRKTRKIEAGRYKGKIISEDVRQRIKDINAMIVDPKAGFKAIKKRINELYTLREELEAKSDTMTDQEMQQLDDIAVALIVNNAFMSENDNPNKTQELIEALTILNELEVQGRTEFQTELEAARLRYRKNFAMAFKEITGLTINWKDLSFEEAYDEVMKREKGNNTELGRIVDKQSKGEVLTTAEFNKLRNAVEKKKSSAWGDARAEALDRLKLENQSAPVKGAVRRVKRNIGRVGKKMLRFLDHNMIATAEDLSGLMDRVLNSTGKLFEGPLMEFVADNVRSSTREFKKQRRLQQGIFYAKYEDIYGKKWAKAVRKNAVINPLDIYYSKKANDILVEQKEKIKKSNASKRTQKDLILQIDKQILRNQLELSQNQMYYIYNQFKDPALRYLNGVDGDASKTLENTFSPDRGLKTMLLYEFDSKGNLIVDSNGEFKITQQAVQGDAANVLSKIEEELDEKVKEWADWQVDVYFPSVYSRYNDVYKNIYRTAMPQNQYYAGRLFRDNPEEAEPITVLPVDEKGAYNPIAPESTKARLGSDKGIHFADGDNAMVNYMRDMEYFAAYAETIRDIHKVFSDKAMKGAIAELHGENINEYINDAIQKIANKGSELGMQKVKIINSLNTMFLLSRLGANLTLVAKQMTSSLTYANDIGYLNWMKYAVLSIPKLLKTHREIMENSIVLQDRYGYTIDVNGKRVYVKSTPIQKNIENYEDQKLINMMPGRPQEALENITRLLMLTTMVGDRAAILIGGIPNYLYYKSKYKKAGLSEEEAVQQAIVSFEKDTLKTQQSYDLQDKDYYQTGHPFTRAFNMFLTTPKQYFRREVVAMRNLYRKIRAWDANAGRGTIEENIRTFITYHFIMPMLFEYVSQGFPGLLRDMTDEDKEELKWAALLGNLNAIFIYGQALESVVDYLILDKSYGSVPQSLPVLESTAKLMDLYKRATNAKKQETADRNWDKFFLELVSVTGIPASQIKKIWKNYSELGSADGPGDAMLLIMGFSEYMRKRAEKKGGVKLTEREKELYIPGYKQNKDRIQNTPQYKLMQKRKDQEKKRKKKLREDMLKRIYGGKSR